MPPRSPHRERTQHASAALAARPDVWVPLRVVAPLLCAAWLLSCAAGFDESRVVTATAYTSHPEQTDDDPRVAAWGDPLEPGMRAIAVSRDLVKAGLTRGARVRIEGLPGMYVVLDKMATRWRNKIDIYMGDDVRAARRFGVREVRIHWSAPGDEPGRSR